MIKPLIQTIEIIGKLEIVIGKELLAKVTTILASAPQIILLDLRQVEFVDSGGLGAIVRSFKLSEKLGIRFVVCSTQPHVSSMFRLTSMTEIMEIYESQEKFYQKLIEEIPEYSQIQNIPQFISSMTIGSVTA